MSLKTPLQEFVNAFTFIITFCNLAYHMYPDVQIFYVLSIQPYNHHISSMSSLGTVFQLYSCSPNFSLSVYRIPCKLLSNAQCITKSNSTAIVNETYILMLSTLVYIQLARFPVLTIIFLWWNRVSRTESGNLGEFVDQSRWHLPSHGIGAHPNPTTIPLDYTTTTTIP